jgi:hypothetical protein
MEIRNQIPGEASPMAALVGTVRDQSALLGVLKGDKSSLFEFSLTFFKPYQQSTVSVSVFISELIMLGPGL